MHVVVIHDWNRGTAEMVQILTQLLGVTPFEASQRLMGGGPAVMAGFAESGSARSLAIALQEKGIPTFVIDAESVRGATGHLVVRRFELCERFLLLDSVNGKRAEIPYGEIEVLLPALGITTSSETRTLVERKLSIGKTILSGGIPISKKVERKEEVKTEERRRLLYLYTGNRLPALFSQDGMSYEGLGVAMKHSRELNFTYLTNEMRRLAAGAAYDERLLNRVAQFRLLGPGLAPETHLDLAAEILARTLRAVHHFPGEIV